MKSIYIFTEFPQSYAPPRLKEEAQKMGLEASVYAYKVADLSVKGKNLYAFVNGKELAVPDYAILRSSGKSGRYLAIQQGIFKWLKRNNVRILNDETLTKHQHFNKVMQHLEFSIASIPHIETKIVMSLDRLSSSISTYPCVVKSFSGSHGDKVKKIEKEEDIYQFDEQDAPLLLQPFLHAGKDIRIIVLGFKVLGAMARIAKEGAFLTNYSAGGMVEVFELEKYPEVIEIAEKTAEQMSCEYAGVDLMQDDEGNWRVLEVNRSCQFEGFEKSTNINVAKIVIEYLTL